MVKKKKIIVIPDGGLGNRMRVLASCIQIAVKENRALWIVWPNNSSLGCDITDIFESIGMNYQVPSKLTHALLSKIYRHGLIYRFYKFYKLLSKVIYGNSIFDDDIIDYRLNRLKQTKINSKDSTLLVATCLAFGNQDQESSFTEYWKNEENRKIFKLFKFTDYLKNEANQNYKEIGGPYIGIHIRRTDHVNLIKHSPFENYLAQIDKCILNMPGQKFFLATDDEQTKKFLIEKYKNLIFTLNYKLGREDLDGIYGAVIELLLLSKSTKIICSVLSSYSTTAILINDVKEVIYV